MDRADPLRHVRPLGRTLQPAPQRHREQIAWCVAVLAAALVGAWGSADAPAVYASLRRPPWAPSAAIFGPVWMLLYLTLAAAAAWASQAPRTPQRRQALMTLGAALVPLALWSWTFFAWRSSVLSVICISLLGGLVMSGIVQLLQVHRGAALLLLPLLGWLAFAAALNVEIVRLNPLL